jgi:hypothetical protein
VTLDDLNETTTPKEEALPARLDVCPTNQYYDEESKSCRQNSHQIDWLSAGIPSLVKTRGNHRAESSTNGTDCITGLFFSVGSVLHMNILVPQMDGKRNSTSDMQKGSVVEFMGPINHIDISPNGLHLYATLRREQWEIKSFSRSKEICNKLAESPKNSTAHMFLSAFETSCNGGQVRNITAEDFISYLCMCPFGVYCPSLSNYHAQPVPSGYYVTLSNELKLCEPGYICYGGIRIKCPIGHVCPHYGESVPTRCNASANGDTTCYEEGLAEEKRCPTGMVCLVPYTPPMPAPPGTCTNDKPGAGTPSPRIIECQIGSWCLLGRSNNDTLLSPAGTFSEHPDVLYPTPCNCSADNCTYCPAGTSVQRPCEAGFFCRTPLEKSPCFLTQWCPYGSESP